ncbi:hypothetical protein TNCV_627681 [Trichonephila clavipes]|nr:hypothetical protein TNCV_627681 [Trichonephila clavipes]
MSNPLMQFCFITWGAKTWFYEKTKFSDNTKRITRVVNNDVEKHVNVLNVLEEKIIKCSNVFNYLRKFPNPLSVYATTVMPNGYGHELVADRDVVSSPVVTENPPCGGDDAR